jgi:hypothetical protein
MLSANNHWTTSLFYGIFLSLTGGLFLMLNLPEVEEAKAIMTGAVNWSVMKWLAEKKKVRKAADLANNALNVLDKQVKASWSGELKFAYDELPPTGWGAGPLGSQKDRDKKISVDAKIKLLAKTIKQADQEAYLAHMDAEDTFDRAEKRLSTSMAREGSRKAIISWEVREKAILQSKRAVSVVKST